MHQYQDQAYSILSIKSVDEERRTFSGTATSPKLDSDGDIVEPLGVQYTNPTPLLLFHDRERPVGSVNFHPPTADGVNFTASIPKIAEPGTLQNRVDEAWQSVKHRLIGGVSVKIAAKRDWVKQLQGGGIHWLKSQIRELSLVTFPANSDATIHTIKSLDIGLAASGTGSDVDSHTTSGVSDTTRVVKTMRQDRNMKKPISDQIRDFENTRAAKVARMDEMLEKSGESGASFDAAEKEEYDGLDADVKMTDEHLTRLRTAEERQKAAAMPVRGDTVEKAAAARAGVITVNPVVPKGTAFTRYAMALSAARGSRLEAIEYAKRWEGSTPEVITVLKAAMTAGTTTDSDWAAPLVVYQNMASEFIELLRPETILGKIPGLRKVPFNVTMPTQTQGATMGWVGQTLAKPVSELKFGQNSLGMAKAAGIIVISEELARSSQPSAEAIIRSDMIAAMAEFLDVQFVDPSVAAVANVSPASITHGVTPVAATGNTYAAFVADYKTLVSAFRAANLSTSGAVWIMTETQAEALALMQNALGQPSFPTITATGGTLLGRPVITSEAVPLDGGSPNGGRIILVKPSEILFADDGGVTIDVSREASVQMNSTPDNPETASTVFVNLWQNNLVGLRAERFINWVKRRAEAVGYINDANYGSA